jgi:hypothetical protein
MQKRYYQFHKQPGHTKRPPFTGPVSMNKCEGRPKSAAGGQLKSAALGCCLIRLVGGAKILVRVSKNLALPHQSDIIGLS